MFNLSSKVEYGILGVLTLCLHAGERSLSVRSIAEKETLSIRFLEQAMNRLKETGLIESIRGPYGGYRLARAPKEIKLSDVIYAMEGEKRQKKAGFSLSSKPEILTEILSNVETVLEHHLNTINFEYLTYRVKILQEKEALMFHI